MANGFLYYMPDSSTIDAERIRSEHFSDVLGDVEIESVGVARGPGDSGAGIVLAERGGDARTGFYPDAQTWRRIATAGRAPAAWLGWSKDDPPGPRELRRPDALDGDLVALGDGRQWEIPRALAFEGGSPPFSGLVPRHSEVGAAGEWIRGEVVERYRALWEAALFWWDVIVSAQFSPAEGGENGDQVAEWDAPAIHDRAVDVLASSYRLGRDEVGALRLFTDQTVYRILGVSIDADTIFAYLAQKKTDSAAPAPSGIEPGAPAPSPATVQHSPISSSPA